MSEEIHDQVSAFMDDELSTEECAFLVRRLERDPGARTKLVRYSLIGSTMRRDLLVGDPDMLRRRIHEALNGTAPALKPAVAVKPTWRRRIAAPAVGVGVAATVALASLLVVRNVNQNAEPAGSARSAPLLSADTSPSYVVPQDAQSNGGTVQAPIRLTNYLVYHGEYTSLLDRTAVHSTLIGASDGPIVEAATPLPTPPGVADQDAQ